MKIKKLFLSFLFIFLVSGCALTKNDTNVNSKEENLYISTKFVDRREYANNAEYVDSQFGWFEVKTNDGYFHDMGIVTNYGGYSDGFVDADNEVIYYRDRHYIDEEKFKIDGDQIYSYDINTQETKKWSDILYLTNYIFKAKDKLYAIAQTAEYNSMMLFEINTVDNSIKFVSEDRDIDIRRASYNPITEELIMICQSTKEIYEAIDAQTDAEDSFFRAPELTIYSYKNGEFKKIVDIGHGEAFDVVANDDYIIFDKNDTKMYNATGKEEVIFSGYMTYDRNTGELTPGVFGENMSSFLSPIFYLSEDSSYMIARFAGTSPEKVVKYTFDSKKEEDIFDLEKFFGSRGTVMYKLMLHEDN